MTRNSRRGFLLLCLFVAFFTPATLNWAAEHSFQTARRPGDVDLVTVELEFSGNLSEVVEGKSQKVPQQGRTQLTYEEETLAAATDGTTELQSVRVYNESRVAWKIGDDEVERQLSQASAKLMCVVESGRPLLFAPSQPLTREDLEIAEVIGNSLILEQLLPQSPVALNAKWKPDDAILAALVLVDKVTDSTVTCSLKEVTDDVARFEIDGTLSALVHDVTTRIELKGRYRFDRRTNRIDWIGLLLQEQREISVVARGFEVVGRLQVRILPQKVAKWLTGREFENVEIAVGPEAERLMYEPADHRWQLLHDRRWFLYREQPDIAIFRFINDGQYVAQAKLWHLPSRKPDDLPTPEAFQEEVRVALGKDFGSLVEAGEFSEGDDYRIYRVVVAGEPSEIPMFWHYYLIADKSGRQATVAVTFEEKRGESFGGADRELIAGFRFLEAKDRPTAEPTKADPTSKAEQSASGKK
ncbi:MAG: hypothetical protein ACOY3P_14555 [Planctomycetota bacterium]